MKITQSGFYTSSDIVGSNVSPNVGANLCVCPDEGDATPGHAEIGRTRRSAPTEITIGDNIEVSFFDDGDEISSITIGKNTTLNYYGNFKNGEYSKYFTFASDSGKLNLKTFLFAKNSQTKARIHAEANTSNTTMNMDIVSLAGEEGKINLDGILQIGAGVEKVTGSLNEENIFLGNTASIRGIPTLLVASNDIEAAHACKIEKISDEQLFYLRSRGLQKEDAVSMMLEAKVRSIFGGLEVKQQDFYEVLMKKILGEI